MHDSILLKNSKNKIEQIKLEIKDAYCKDQIPWVIAYSGGKDSTMTVQIVLETISEMVKKPEKEIHILYADTKVELPPVVANAKTFLEKIEKWAKEKDLPVKTKILNPPLEESFFVLVLGKGYLPPTRYFRWCTERLKVRPIKNYIRELIRERDGCVVVLGLRLKESATRDRGLRKRGYSKWMSFDGVKGANIYAPILELSVEEVWSYLLVNESQWSVDNYDLRILYTGGNSSCSLFCGGIRFGCWVCTVVKKDRCTEGLSHIPGWEWLGNLLVYRDLMLEVRNNPKNRMWIKNNGRSYLGPLNLEARKFLYEKLKELEHKIGHKILSAEEEQMIYDFWKNEKRYKEQGYNTVLGGVVANMEAGEECDLERNNLLGRCYFGKANKVVKKSLIE